MGREDPLQAGEGLRELRELRGDDAILPGIADHGK
jgi:hypothetical protein